MVLAARETLGGSTTVPRFGVYRSANDQFVHVPDYLLNTDLKLSLKHLCREAIRKQLMKFNCVNLFVKVPELRGLLPAAMLNYLLYNTSVEDYLI